MFLKKWEDLPLVMQNEHVRPYYDSLQKKKKSLILKLVFDRVVALVMLLGLSPVFLVLAILIKIDSQGDVFFRQERVTQYGKKFKIYKFRTMVKNAECLGTQVTITDDIRITRLGKKMRGCRLDEVPQLINIIKGEMSFVGTRPEVSKYVEAYTDEMLATLLLPAGVTSEASIEYRDEEKLLNCADNIDEIYIRDILPHKMRWNLQALKKVSFWEDCKIMLKTVNDVL